MAASPPGPCIDMLNAVNLKHKLQPQSMLLPSSLNQNFVTLFMPQPERSGHPSAWLLPICAPWPTCWEAQQAALELPHLLGMRSGSRSRASNMKMQPSADVAKSRVSSEPMRKRSTAVLKQRCSWKSPVSGSL